MNSDTLSNHYEHMFNTYDGEIYNPPSEFDKLSMDRKVEILKMIELPDLSDLVVMDYGVGSWGFGCIFNELKSGKELIGVDISDSAIGRSAKLSADDPQLNGKTVKYIRSLGYTIDVPDEHVDVLFCGECIEHVEDTDAFLVELSRIMKPGGLAIFTTPNASPFTYRQLGMKWCMGFEHVALMDFDEFSGWLDKYFVVERIYGYNQTIHPDLDNYADHALQSAWVSASLDDPRNASSLIGVVRKPIDGPVWPSAKIVSIDNFDMTVTGPSRRVDLVEGVQGLLVEPGAQVDVPVPPGAIRCNLILWSHDWSGMCEIACGDYREKVDLYCETGGCLRIKVPVENASTITIVPSDDKSPLSRSFETIVYRATFAQDA